MSNNVSIKEYTKEHRGPFTDNAVVVLENRYLDRDASGELIETPKEMVKRVADHVASVEDDQIKWASKFYTMMWDQKFMPNSPTLMNAGRSLGMLSACFVLPLKDSIEDIMGTAKQIALVQRAGGGTGVDLSELRPRDSIVRSSGGTTSGPLSFLKMLSGVTDAIQQGAFRRGANMGTMRIDHPDIIDFIKLKENLSEVTNYNLSVTIPDSFMELIRDNKADEIHWVSHPHQNLKGAILKETGRPVYLGAGFDDYGSEEFYTSSEIFDLIVDKAWKSGEPGLIFLDRINEVNPTPNVGPMTSTNPCVTGDTRLHTSRGLVTARELYETQEPLICTVDKRSLGKDEEGVETRPAVPVFMTARNAEVFEVTLQSGHRIKATEWHEFYTDNGKKKLTDLTFKDSILLQSGEGQFGEEGSYEEGLLLGLIAGDGHFTNRGKGQIAATISLWGDDRDLAERVLKTVNGMVKRKVGIIEVPDRNEVRIRSVALAKALNDKYGFNKETKLRVPEVVFKGSRECVRGYLQGLFTADGTIQIGSGCSARLASSHPDLLSDVQMLLSNFGVSASLYKRREAGLRTLPDGKGGYKEYDCLANYELIMYGNSRDRFMAEIGFVDGCSKNQKYSNWSNSRQKASRPETFSSLVSSITSVGQEDVYDTTQDDHNCIVFNGIVTGNCGEQPLLPYEACNLGSINLSAFVQEDQSIDWEGLEDTIRTSIRFLDNVVECNNYPTPEIDKMCRDNRKIGLGVMGWADMLFKKGMRYDSTQALELAEEVGKFIQMTAWDEDQKLAAERGCFANWEGSRWDIELNQPMRNAHCVTIAPTGTISIIANCSGGIEPIFSLAFKRQVMKDRDGNHKVMTEVNPIFLQALEDEGLSQEDIDKVVDHVATVGTLSLCPVRLPPSIYNVYRSARDITPEWHVRMQSAWQKHTDAAVSKTLNFPNTATREDVRVAYVEAWTLNCKGVTVYRDGSRDEQPMALNNEVSDSAESEEEDVVKEMAKELNPACPTCVM